MGVVQTMLSVATKANVESALAYRTALHAAAGLGHAAIVKCLLENSADINGRVRFTESE